MTGIVERLRSLVLMHKHQCNSPSCEEPQCIAYQGAEEIERLRRIHGIEAGSHHDLCASNFWNYTHGAQAAMQSVGEWPPVCNCRDQPESTQAAARVEP